MGPVNKYELQKSDIKNTEKKASAKKQSEQNPVRMKQNTSTGQF